MNGKLETIKESVKSFNIVDWIFECSNPTKGILRLVLSVAVVMGLGAGVIMGCDWLLKNGYEKIFQAGAAIIGIYLLAWIVRGD